MPNTPLSQWMDHLNPARKDRLAHAGRLIEQGERAQHNNDPCEALIFYQEAFQIQAELLGLDHPEVTALVDRLSQFVEVPERQAGACAFFEQSAGGSPQQRHSAALLADRLGNSLFARQAIPEARAFYELAVRLYEVPGADGAPTAYDPQILYVLQKLVGLFFGQGDLPEARACLERILALDEAQFGPAHPRVAADLSSLAHVLRDLGELEAARTSALRALQIDQAGFEPEHPRVVNSLVALASLHKDLGELHEARARLEQALAIDEARFDLNHPKVAIDLHALADITRQQGDYAATRGYLERALAMAQQIHGPQHPRVVSALEALGDALLAMDDLPAASGHFEQALRQSESLFGARHLRTATLLQKLGGVQHSLGDTAAAQAAYQRALTILEAFLPAGAPELEAARRSLESTRA